jgi:hypothetical protein
MPLVAVTERVDGEEATTFGSDATPPAAPAARMLGELTVTAGKEAAA